MANLKLSHILVSQSLVGVAASLVGAGIWGVQLGASIAIGATMMWVSVVLHGWLWHFLTVKNSIAWSVMVIVFKYAVLLESIYLLSQTQWFSFLGLGVGIASICLTALITLLIDRKKEIKQVG